MGGIASFDLETYDWDNYYLGGYLDSEGTYRDTTDEHKLYSWLRNAEGEIWTWNGGRYDLIWLLQHARDAGDDCKPIVAGARIIRVKIRKALFLDGFAIFPTALVKAATLAGISLTKDTGLACICHEKCGGYCAIRPGLDNSSRERLRQYLRADCEATSAAVAAMRELGTRESLAIRATIGASSYATISHDAGVKPARWRNASDYKFVRDAYAGGRVEVYRPRSDAGHRYDVNSAYPAALVALDLPCGPYDRLSTRRAEMALSKKQIGVYHAIVDVPEMHAPPLFARTSSGTICFPVGEIRGTWTSSELIAAMSVGVSVKPLSAIVWPDSQPIVRDAVQRIWELRASAKREERDQEAVLLKWFANSFTGKLAEHPLKEKYVISPSSKRIVSCPGGNHRGACPENRCCDHRCALLCGSWQPLSPSIWLAREWQISACAHVHWAAFLTAHARLALWRRLAAQGKSAVYCDTDSCFSEKADKRNVGDDLGQWGYDGAYSDWTALARKLYRYRDEAGKWHVASKGIARLSAEDFDAFSRGELFRDKRGVAGFRQRARKGGKLFQRKLVERRFRGDQVHFGGRVLGRKGYTTPCELKEIESWQ